MKEKGKRKAKKDYMIPDRYREQKRIKAPKTSNQDFADMFHVSLKTFQNYVNAKTPVPRDVLNGLSDFFDVAPEYLSGKSNYRKKRIENADKILSHVLAARKLGEYLETRGIQAPFNGLPQTINGVPLSIGEYQAYLQELEEVIFFTTEHYIKNLVAFRDSHLDSIEPAGELMAPSLPDPYPSKDPEANK